MIREGIQVILVILISLIISCVHLFQKASANYFYNDDALFYTVISKNVIESGIFTFDGINKTNGFHWGGMIIYSIVSAGIHLFSSNLCLQKYFHYYSIVDAFLLTIASLCSYKVINSWYGDLKFPLWKRILAVSGLSIILFVGLGMETILFSILLLYFLLCLSKGIYGVWLYVTFSSMIITRIDFAFIIGIAFISYLLYNKRKKILIFFIISFLAGILIVLLLNLSQGNSVESVSSFLKSYGGITFTKFSIKLITLGSLSYLFIYVILLILSIRHNQQNLFALPVLSSTAAIIIYSYVWSLRTLKPGDTFAVLGNWYDLPHLFMGVVTIACLIYQIKIDSLNRLPVLLFLILSLFILIPTSTTAQRIGLENDNYSEYVEFLKIIREKIPYEKKIAIDDWAGITSYYLNQEIISLDGLVNSKDYAINYLTTGKIDQYLNFIKCEYLIVPDKSRIKQEKEYYCYLLKSRFNSAIPVSFIYFKFDQILFEKYNYQLIKLISD